MAARSCARVSPSSPATARRDVRTQPGKRPTAPQKTKENDGPGARSNGRWTWRRAWWPPAVLPLGTGAVCVACKRNARRGGRLPYPTFFLRPPRNGWGRGRVGSGPPQVGGAIRPSVAHSPSATTAPCAAARRATGFWHVCCRCPTPRLPRCRTSATGAVWHRSQPVVAPRVVLA